MLGRLATSVANLLRGKGKVEFRPHILIGDKVIITNASKIKVTGNKMISKIYWKHSGYIGNLKSETMMDVYRKNPSEILRRAVKGMLPKNKLQDKWMKNLTIYNGDING
ncbi:MAG: ribosomal protein [Candidatus Berkelbacteria bacterium]|nr:ribosomal protein [Candidatus Berkelbacteria bacterium]